MRHTGGANSLLPSGFVWSMGESAVASRVAKPLASIWKERESLREKGRGALLSVVNRNLTPEGMSLW